MSNLNDKEYADYLVRLSTRYKERTENQTVFTTNIDQDKLWERYLGSFSNQQYHNCFACRHFLNRYAGLVTIAEDGTSRSAMWQAGDVPDNEHELGNAVRKIKALVEDAKITGVFYSDEYTFGNDTAGGWRHLHLFNPHVFKPISRDSKGSPRNPYQEAAERQVDFTNTWRALREFSPAVVDKAIQILEANALYRGEKVLGRARWLAELHASLVTVPKEDHRKNVVWRAIATAPVGFARPRSSMIGTLLEDIAAGLPMKDIKARFDAKMDPSQYATSQKAPTAEQVEIAESAVETLGIAPAFERRYVDEYDILEATKPLWRPSSVIVEQPRKNGKSSGVFSHLAPTPKPDAVDLEVPPKVITWEKFQRDVLPGASKIQYRVPMVGRFAALTTAADKHAPPILQWDHPDHRNPVAWSFPNPPARAADWNLVAGELVSVEAIVSTPNMWGSENIQHGEGVFLLLECARDMRGVPGGGLFVEHLRSDLKPFRTVIQAHLNKLHVQGAEQQNMAFGIGLLKGHDWTERAAPQKVKPMAGGKAPERVHAFLVMDNSGSMASYLGAARRALRHLLDSLGSMPGRVDVTVISFGSYVSILHEATTLDYLGQVENAFNASSGSTALNDAIGRAIEIGLDMPSDQDTVYFLGIVTDGEENKSRSYTYSSLRQKIEQVLSTGKWTIAYAGAGAYPMRYAQQVGIPEGNATTFAASAEGFEDVGNRYATSTRDLAAAYKSGARASTSFFGAASGRQAIGNDYPVVIVTHKSGVQTAYKLDRWE